jgi:hypothetical protein
MAHRACESGVAAPLCHRTPRRWREFGNAFGVVDNRQERRVNIKQQSNEDAKKA